MEIDSIKIVLLQTNRIMVTGEFQPTKICFYTKVIITVIIHEHRYTSISDVQIIVKH